MPLRRHFERHYAERIGWLRAAVLGANDGIISTASLLIGVAAAGAARNNLLLTGLAGLVAGAMSMAAGEFVSVSSQADSEDADLERERHELVTEPELEHHELQMIYERRGLNAPLAAEVATQLMAHDALGAHARDELGLSDAQRARPLLAAAASAGSFACGALLPLLVVAVARPAEAALAVAAACVPCLAATGALAARIGGAPALRGALRVTLWGMAAMAATAAIGRLFHVVF
jgi:VIT1/CCC1 family predicted Fe2+/Mn2+ transporter